MKSVLRVKRETVRHVRVATEMFITGLHGNERVDLFLGIAAQR
jgi:hypothetical protein